MRLLNTSTLQLERFSSTESTPPYAILSHTWGKDSEEVSFDDMKSSHRSPEIQLRYGFEKIRMTCQLARKVYHLDYAWVDTCCIDQSSSAELSESINSMFKWYHRADVCLAFLADWRPDDKTFAHCKWFTRGWTLQELIAPRNVIFYDRTWRVRGNKTTLCSEISSITRIQSNVLSGKELLSEVPVGVRMSWASRRVTTREEDTAYCLLGIFDINMPMLYGEGNKAFLRLQEEIIKEHPDMSIFAWQALPGCTQDYMGVLAPSPREFLDSNWLHLEPSMAIFSQTIKFSVSNRGVKFRLPCFQDEEGYTILPLCHATDWDNGACGIYLRPLGPQSYIRALPHHFAMNIFMHMLNRDSSLVTASKSISTLDSRNVSQRVLHLTEPSDLRHPDFQLSNVSISGDWHAFSSMLFATALTYSQCQFHFDPEWASEFASFTILCQYVNDRDRLLSSGWWICDITSRPGLSPPGPFLFSSNSSYLSIVDSESTRVEKVLVLPHVRDKRKSKRVVLWLQRDINPTRGQPEFSMGIQVHDGDGEGAVVADRTLSREKGKSPHA